MFSFCADPTTIDGLLWLSCYLTTGKHMAFYLSFLVVLLLLALAAPAALLFGFAGALADIGLPKDDLWLSLLLFNVGIEAGQVAVILVLAVFAWILSRLGWQTLFNKGAAWSMGCLATYWTLDRTFLLF